jgi:iron(III) transport system substrate-binding protein
MRVRIPRLGLPNGDCKGDLHYGDSGNRVPEMESARRSLLLVVLISVAACGDSPTSVTAPTQAGSTGSGDAGQTLLVYAGRSEELVGPLVERFKSESGVDVDIRYGTSSEMAATILSEGSNSPADVFFAQEPASLGSIALLLEPLPESLLSQVPDRFRDPDGLWVGTTVRSRVLAFNPDLIGEDQLPASYKDLVDPRWHGRFAIAPTNASFIAFVSAQILLEGEDSARQWLQGIALNDPIEFDGNSPIAAAVDAGDVAMGLINHYYLLRLEAEQGDITARNHFFPVADAGSLLMPAGASILASARNQNSALAFVEFVLSAESQAYFAESVFEYPVVEGVPGPIGTPALEDLVSPNLPSVDLAAVLDKATDLIAEAGLL